MLDTVKEIRLELERRARIVKDICGDLATSAEKSKNAKMKAAVAAYIVGANVAAALIMGGEQAAAAALADIEKIVTG